MNEIDPEEYPNRRFARTADPEGNPIELWVPNAAALKEPPSSREPR